MSLVTCVTSVERYYFPLFAKFCLEIHDLTLSQRNAAVIYMLFTETLVVCLLDELVS